MNLAKEKISKLYFHYLAAAFGSALITNIFGLVDAAMVGQYYGPSGSAALGVVAPVWNLLYGTGLLVGVGGSVLYSIQKGQNRTEKANRIFSSSILLGLILAACCWGAVVFFEDPLLHLFGADNSFIEICRSYLWAVKLTVPVYLFTQIIAAFLRNDSDPGWATISVLIGGAFNIFGDWFFVFGLDMGTKGAGLATALGAAVSLLMMCFHFLKKKNTLKLRFSFGLIHSFGSILKSGLNTFITDVCMGFLTILFNNQVMKYLGADALSVYAVIVNISTFVQCCGYGVGQASQPIFSYNYGAGLVKRILSLLRLCLASSAVLAIFWTAAGMFYSSGFIRIFMAPTDTVLALAPGIFGVYSMSFLLLPYNVFLTFYFQSVMDSRTATILSIMRGAAISGILILLLPAAEADLLWWAMPVTELLTAVYGSLKLVKSVRNLQNRQKIRLSDSGSLY